MLRSHPCRQSESGKHWFSDAEHDLFIWTNPAGQVTAFQFSYNKSSAEHLISWDLHTGYSHSRIDDGEDVYLKIKMSPLLINTDTPASADLAQEFQQISQTLDSSLSDLIYQTLLAYPPGCEPAS